MKQRYRMFRRENGIYYSLDTIGNKRNSLNTADPDEAKRFLNALNEACQQPAVKGWGQRFTGFFTCLVVR
jgi:hypothetical protein